MNSDNYEKWVKTQLVPNLPPHSVVVKDNASYHNKYRDKIPTTAWKINDILDWLADKHVFEEQIEIDMRRPHRGRATLL